MARENRDPSHKSRQPKNKTLYNKCAVPLSSKRQNFTRHIKEDLNNWGDITYYRRERISIVKMSGLLKLIHEFNSAPIKIKKDTSEGHTPRCEHRFFLENEKIMACLCLVLVLLPVSSTTEKQLLIMRRRHSKKKYS